MYIRVVLLYFILFNHLACTQKIRFLPKPFFSFGTYYSHGVAVQVDIAAEESSSVYNFLSIWNSLALNIVHSKPYLSPKPIHLIPLKLTFQDATRVNLLANSLNLFTGINLPHQQHFHVFIMVNPKLGWVIPIHSYMNHFIL